MAHHLKLKQNRSNSNRKRLTIALAGNANVGKSVIFNQLTGSNQIIGNWPGKTVELAKGTLCFEDYEISVVDLPGIYSFSTFSMEEIVSRDFVALEKPDVVINVLDASILERNLFFTIQLIEMQVPLVVCLNQVDIAHKKGIVINREKLERILGVPVVFTIATRGEGLYELVKAAVEHTARKSKKKELKYSLDVETRIHELSRLIETETLELEYPSRWVSIKLLEGDNEIVNKVSAKSPKVVNKWKNLSKELSIHCQEPCFSVIASERYSLASMIASCASTQSEMKSTFSEKLDWLTTHRVLGYITSAGVILGLLLWTFVVGNFLSALISDAMSIVQPLDPKVSGDLLTVLWNGVFTGFVAGVTLVIPYVIPFYLLLAVIEDSGILTRVAFMMDSLMHKIGLHGKALIPLILGFGCNVPAIHSCRIMETRRERLLAAFTVTFAPCAARTIIILGLVGAFLGIQWAVALYVVDLAVIFVMGRLALRAVPGKSTGLIMEISSFKLPSLSVVGKQTWARTKSIIYVVFPIYIIGSAAVQALYAFNVLPPLGDAMAPLTVGWLGLPVATGVLLILGVVRKEFIILGAAAVFGSTQLSLFLSPVQLVTLALVGMLYIPCLSTIAVLAREFSWKAAATMTLANVFSAILIGGLTYRLLSLFM